MTELNELTPQANDGFEEYYTEKIWDWIPAVYKTEDGLAANPGVLRALVEILATQAAVARRSIDRLWEDQFIEYSDDWTVPYIGDLIGTRLVHELNVRGRRVDVAKTIFYRRRKGTPLVLEVLTRDITGWEGVTVESFRRLGRTRHRLDPVPLELESPVSKSLPGGWAKLNSARGGELIDGPFDEYSHTADLRQLRGNLGRYNISKLNFHLFRLKAFPVRLATPAGLGDNRFTFDPSGRDMALYRPSQRPDPDQWRRVREWEIPAPIPCSLLGAASYEITSDILDFFEIEELARYIGQHFKDETRLRTTLRSLQHGNEILANIATLLDLGISTDSPKLHLLFAAVEVSLGADADPQISDRSDDSKVLPPIKRSLTVSGNLSSWGEALESRIPDEKILIIDPEIGRFVLRGGSVVDNAEPFVPLYHFGFSGNIGAGTYDRRAGLATGNIIKIEDENGGTAETSPTAVTVNLPPVPSLPIKGVFEYPDSRTYRHSNEVTGIESMVLQAANSERPYIQKVSPEELTWLYEANGDENDHYLSFEGLWLGIVKQEPDSVAPNADGSCPPVEAQLILEGDFKSVTLRHCTLDPGGERARIETGQCVPIPYVKLVVRGNVEELIIESCIMGPLLEEIIRGDRPENPDTLDACSIGRLVIRDSIVQSISSAVPALQIPSSQVCLERVTVFGDVRVNRLEATETLIQGLVVVTDNQHGCFRFSAANKDNETRLPPQFQSRLYAPGIPNHFFVSRRFGDAGFGQLSPSAPNELVRGAENRSELGAFNTLINTIKLDDLKAKVNEYMPFGLIAQTINET